jgi:hypothetical protein
MPAKRNTRQNISAENVDAQGAVGGAPPPPPPFPEGNQPVGAIPRSPPIVRGAGALPRTPPMIRGNADPHFVRPEPVRLIHGPRVGHQPIELPPPNYAEILAQPDRNPPVNNALEGEALRALVALQRQVLEELQRSRRDQGQQRMLEAERHDRLFQAVQANHRQQEPAPAPNPDNQINFIPPGNNAARPQNLLPSANYPEHCNIQNIPIVDVGHAPPQRRANLQVDEPPPPYNMMFPEGNVEMKPNLRNNAEANPVAAPPRADLNYQGNAANVQHSPAVVNNLGPQPGYMGNIQAPMMVL